MSLRQNERRVDRFICALPLVALVALLSLLLSVACGGNGSDSGNAAQLKSDRDAGNVSAGVSTVRSSAGSAPQRIVSLSPSTTEMLYGVGAFERVVAVSSYDKFPPEVASLPKVGGWSNTNLEQVVTLKPDLIVMTSSQAPLIKDKLDALGIRTLIVPSYTVADALAGIEQIGAATGRADAARQLVSETRAKLEDVRSRARSLPKVRVLCVVDRVSGTLRGLYAATQGSYFAELIEIAGAESVAPPGAGGYVQISKEAVVALDPDIILDMLQSDEGQLAENAQEVWRELANVKAVREGRVYRLLDESMLHPSQFVGDTARKFAELMHPEAFNANRQ